jgi:O-6-methylguanine DNA methyltransferase
MGIKRSVPRGPNGLTVTLNTPLGWSAFQWRDGQVSALTFGHDSPLAASEGLVRVASELRKQPVVRDQEVAGPDGREMDRHLLLEEVHFPDCLPWIEERLADGFRDEYAAAPGDELATQRGRGGARRQLVTREAAWIAELAWRLVAYGRGEVVDFQDIPLDQSALTSFQRRVTEACRAIPYGTTLTYAELAERVGTPRGARAVGNVMRRNPWPLLVPCHRVVGSSGKLGGYSAPDGLSMKRRLLALESDALQTQNLAHECQEVISHGPRIAVGTPT